jgi:2-polyprenyl-3-methyl-5-hydroxy-6-metoxy-1,4-benzoquinol methylase
VTTSRRSDITASESTLASSAIPPLELSRCESHNLVFRVINTRGSASARLVLACPQGCEIPVRGGVPRFVETQHYAGSFGLEWLRFRNTQLDSVTGTRISAQRLERCLGFPLSALQGKRVLEIGCGSGRFTEVLLEHGATVCSLDLSEAVEAAYENVGHHPRCLIVQANAVKAPFAKDAFDVVLCLGVLQHTENPEETLRAISRHAAPEGLVVVDNYALTARRVLALRYPLRFIIKHLSYERAHRLCRKMVAAWLPLHRAVGRRLWLHAFVSRVSPVATYYHVYPQLSDAQQEEFAKLDTIDFYTPKYERLQTVGSMRRLLRRARLEPVSVSKGGNGIETRSRRAL